jgi:hypothetical protein
MSSTSHRPRRYRPRLEALEERCLPTTFFVMLPTDNGGAGGQGFGPIGDLRYCISQTNAAHTAAQDTIEFLTPGTITLNPALGPLVLSDAHPLEIRALYQGWVTISGGDHTQVFAITGGTVAMSNLVISHGFSSDLGGGIINYGNLTLTDCILDHEACFGDGGGLFNSGNLTLTGCILDHDTAGFEGGGLYNDGLNVALTGCTLSNDSASFGGGMINQGKATLTNCTLSNNSATYGGGMMIEGTATLTNCTLSNNSATYGGGIYNELGSSVNLTNTIVAGNSAPTGPDIDNRGTVSTADHNLIGDGTDSGISNGVNGNQVGGNGNPVINPRLGPLADNGGPTQTLALLPGSPAIGKADNAAAPHTDQRGHVRLDESGETTDIGAFEL